MRPETTDRFYDIMAQSYEDADQVEKGFWMWVMSALMPIVSKSWAERVKGVKSHVVNSATGEYESEHLLHYLSCSDFAYIPMVIKVYGDRELEEVGDKRKRGRTKGQSGMMSKENIAQYVESVVKMKAVFDKTEYKSYIVEWGEEVFAHIDKLEKDAASQSKMDRAALAEAARTMAVQDPRRKKKDEIEIPF
jgi:hypothetical protein